MKDEGFKIGLVKWFDNTKGYGVIETNENQEYFLHIKNILFSESKILTGTPFIFEVGIPKEGKSAPAINSRVPSTNDDFYQGMTLVGKSRVLSLEATFIFENRFGNEYTKRGEKRHDILHNFFYKILRKRSKDEILELFKISFQANYSIWEADEIVDFYRLTKDCIGYLKLDKNEFEFTEDEIKGVGIDFTLQHKIINQLIDYYNTLVNDRYKVYLWKEGEIGYYKNDDYETLFPDHLNDLPFDETVFINNPGILEPEDFIKLDNFKISESVKNDLYIEVYDRVFDRPISNYDELKTQVLLFNKLGEAKRQKYFELVLSKIPDELIFENWFRKYFYINGEEKIMMGYCPPKKDFKISLDVIEKHIDVIDYKILERIIQFHDESDVAKFIVSKYNSEFIDDKNIIDVMKSIELLSEESQYIIFDQIFDDLISNYIIQIIEKDLLQIESKSTGKILKYVFPISETLEETFLQSFADSFYVDIEDKISIVKTFRPDSIDEEILRFIPHSINHFKLRILELSSSQRTFNHIQEAWSFYLITETYPMIKIASEKGFDIHDDFWNRFYEETEEIPVKFHFKILKRFSNDKIVYNCIKSLDFNKPQEIKKFLKRVRLSEEYKEAFLNKYISNLPTITISNLIYISGIFSKSELPYSIDDFRQRLSDTINREEFIALISYLPELDTKDKQEFEDLIINYIDKNVQMNDTLIDECIPIVESNRILESILRKCDDVENPVSHIDNLFNAKSIGSLSVSFIEEYLTKFISIVPIRTLELIIDHFPSLYNIFANKVVLDKASFVNYLKLLLKKNDELIQLSDGENELNIIAHHFNDLQNDKYYSKLQVLFERYSYSFQLEYIKFLCFQHYQKKLSKEDLFTLIKKIKFIQLSALIIREFIINEIKSRHDLMDLMNRNLKEHFEILLDKKFSEDDFMHIFTLDSLVKKCSGRKKYTGLKFWKNNDIVRWYTEGNHRMVSKGNEGIFCEGRFWHKQPFYYSYNKKPTEEEFEFFWCKNDYCTKVNDSVDFDLGFEEWTLNEINEIFGTNLDRLSFTYVAGWMNRMKSIFDRLKCSECGHFLRPKHYIPKKLGYYAVPLFNCINGNCPLNSIEIRFTHCIGCGKILDSRECKTCNECNWLICDDENCNRCGCGAEHNSVYVQYD